jgi:hypothetical protein
LTPRLKQRSTIAAEPRALGRRDKLFGQFFRQADGAHFAGDAQRVVGDPMDRGCDVVASRFEHADCPMMIVK